MNSIVDVVDAYDQLAAVASTRGPEEIDALCEFLERRVPELLAKVPDDRVEKMRIYYVDKYYRIFNRLEQFDARLCRILACVGTAFEADTRRRGRPIAYLADNGLDPSRLPVLRPFFGPLGLPVLCPEDFQRQVRAEFPGITDDEALADAKAICARGLVKLAAERRNLLVVSYHYSLDEWKQLATSLASANPVVAFRNDAPIDGTSIDIWS